MVEAVLFDLDDTLHDDSATFRAAALDVSREVAREYGIDAVALADAYTEAAVGFWSTLTREGIGTSLGRLREEMWHAALIKAGLPGNGLAQLCADAYNRYRMDHLRVWPEVPALLADLRAAGCKLGLVTNGFAETHREKIALLELEPAFDAIFIADEVGMVKPDPALFLHACARLNAAPQRTIMVGDRYDRDVKGAHDAGLRTVWLNVRNEPMPQDVPAPDATIREIGQLGGALRALGAG